MASTTVRPRGAGDTTDEFRLGGHIKINRIGFWCDAPGPKRLEWPGARDPETGRAVLRRAVELGVNHIDTADYYRSGDGAVRANSLIHAGPLSLFVRACDRHQGRAGLRSTGVLRPAAAGDLRALVEANLKSLGLNRLDLVYLRIGMMTPPHGESLGERFEALAALREEGLIGHLGLSNVDADHLAEARGIAPVAACTESLSCRQAGRGGCVGRLRGQRYCVRPLRPTRERPHRLQRRPAGQGRGPAWRHGFADRVGLAPGALARHSGHPRHRLSRPPSGEHRGPFDHVQPGRPRRPGMTCKWRERVIVRLERNTRAGGTEDPRENISCHHRGAQ